MEEVEVIEYILGEYMKGYPAAMTDEQIKEEFKKKFGFEPKIINRDRNGCVLAGPWREMEK